MFDSKTENRDRAVEAVESLRVRVRVRAADTVRVRDIYRDRDIVKGGYSVGLQIQSELGIGI